jgi:hypothetical protein
MAKFVIRDAATETEVQWDNGIVTANNDVIRDLIDSRARIAHDAGWNLLPDHFVVENPEAPEHTRDMMAVFAILTMETQFGDPLFPDAEIVEFDRPSFREWYDKMRETSSLPGRLVLWN